MRACKISAQSVGLEELGRQIKAWRATRPNTRPMPPELWRQATLAARKIGIYPVSRALRVNYGMLKRRVEARRSSPDRNGEADRGEPLALRRAGFVEVSGLAHLSAASAVDRMVVEVVASDGAKLTIRLQEASANVVTLIESFRGRS
jgi:hypothetical protein